MGYRVMYYPSGGGMPADGLSVNGRSGFTFIAITPEDLTVPTISGTAQDGQTLTATTGTWTNNPTSFTYQWNRV